ncbi:chymotrypsin-2-like [Copidosoma floridanum]|uniref:chymotrypsin-2-like n=1 Tax=Copidosoma floridanum TaxID=29053 RepID=UPI0006C99ED4|nr:chymotrypsin-2-like [Copidosoma floridanum]
MELFLALVLSSLALTQGRFLESRIVNGENAQPGEIPFQVSLQMGYHFCGGSILNQNYVVTAAHCLYGQKAEKVTVIVGVVSLSQARFKYQAERLIVHENYDPRRIVNDIALIKVFEPFQFTKFVQPVRLPDAYSKVETHSLATVSGWGSLMSSGGEAPDHLQKANIFIADLAYCKQVMLNVGGYVSETNICANDPKMRRGQCNGDSGGPLTVDGKLTGIVSWSIKDPYCASTIYPGVYTRVSEYINWIHDNTV